MSTPQNFINYLIDIHNNTAEGVSVNTTSTY